MKLVVVVQRYGAEINGGAELHARYIAEMLARRHDVEVVTTCALDYVTWGNALPPGESVVNGVRVRRFPVDRERVPEEFGRLSKVVFDTEHSVNDELEWLDSEGPTSRALVDYLATRAADVDYFLFFSYRYYHAWHGPRRVPGKSILVPTAERDAAIGLSIFAPLFRGVRAVMYNSFEEQAMIRSVSRNDDVPGVVVGIGSELPAGTDPERFRRTFDIRGPFVVYVGRIDENKGCKELFDFFGRFLTIYRPDLTLVLIGNSILPIPDDPQIRHLGFLPDQDKFDAIAAADALMMPSYFESLSMVALEAWGLGRPVVANAKCDVLQGQCLRSNAGLFYETFDEFAEVLRVLTTNRRLNRTLGENGRAYYTRHYTWPVIEQKYEAILAELTADTRPTARTEPLPGFLARRRRTLPPASQVLARIPAGAAPGHRRDEIPERPDRRTA